MALVQSFKATALTSEAPTPLPVAGFKMLDSQVAGHLQLRSKPCFLVDEDGFVLKMVDFATAGSCGFTETGFFESIFNADETERELVEARKFFPFYHGLLQLNFGGEKFWYLKLENLVSSFSKPSVMDIKVGQRTYDPFADKCKVQKEIMKYKFQKELGFRILGSKSYKPSTGSTEFLDKNFGKSLKPDEILPHLVNFMDLAAVPARLYLVNEIISKLKAILAWFSCQRRIKFYSSSILIGFDGARTEYGDDIDSALNGAICPKEDVIVRMIDFPHTYIDLKGDTSLDTNYIYGLENLVRIFETLASNNSF